MSQDTYKATDLSTSGTLVYSNEPTTQVGGTIHVYAPELAHEIGLLNLTILLVGFWNLFIQFMRWLEDRKR